MPPPIVKANKILVRMPNWIGDVVMSLPAFERIHKRFPNAEIVVAARSAVADLLRSVPGVTGVLPVDWQRSVGGVMDFLQFSGLLRNEKFDLAVLFQNAFRAALLVRLAGIPRRVGYDRDARGWLLTHPVALPDKSAPSGHESAYYLELVRRMGWAETTPPVHQFKILPEPATLKEMRRWLGRAGVTGRPLRVAIAPGASNGTARQWPAERFAQLADRLATERNAAIVLCGSPAERELGSRIEGKMKERAHSYFDDLSLMEMHAMFSCMDVVISNDSGASHLAATVGVPQVVIFGPTDEKTTAPLNPRAQLVRQPVECSPCFLQTCPIDHRCMTRLEVEQVWQAVEKIRRKAGA